MTKGEEYKQITCRIGKRTANPLTRINPLVIGIVFATVFVSVLFIAAILAG